MVLPHVLRYSAPAITDRLAQLAVRAGLGHEDEAEDVLAEKFMAGVEALNRDLQIPTQLDALQVNDIPALARAACKEAHTGYPVPRYMTISQCEGLIRKLLPKVESRAQAKKPARPSPRAKTPVPAKSTKVRSVSAKARPAAA
jgi:alcohol dehydrogenase class IV